jgi:hypothetical protein
MTAEDVAAHREAGADAVRQWSDAEIEQAAAALVDAMAPAIAQQQQEPARRSA